MGNKVATKVLDFTKFYAQLNYALANTGLAAWDSKSVSPPIPIPLLSQPPLTPLPPRFFYDACRPVPGIQPPKFGSPQGKTSPTRQGHPFYDRHQATKTVCQHT